MRTDPRERYPSAEALIRDIDHYFRSEPLDARPDTLHYRARKFVSRNRRVLAATVLATMLVVGLVVFFTIRLARARDAALAEAARTQRVERFMENIFQGGEKDAGPTDDLRVVTLLDRGLQEAQSLSQDPAVQADSYQTLGTIYRQLGKFDQADKVLRSALHARRSLGPDGPATADTLLALALLRIDQAQLPEAERLVRDALTIDGRDLPPNDPAFARALGQQGRVLNERGQYDKALEVLTRAQQIQSANAGANGDLAETLDLLADAHFYLGHYPLCDSLNRQTLAILEQLHGPKHPSVADVCINLGNVQFQLGHWPEAEQHYRRALAIEGSWYGKDHPLTARAENYVAQALENQGRYDESLALLQPAIDAIERAYGNMHPRVALVLSNLSFVAIQMGKLNDAEKYTNRMADIYRSAYGNEHQLTAKALSNLAGVYHHKEEYARAERAAREAFGIYSAAVPAGHMERAIAELRLGRAIGCQKRYQEAEPYILDSYNILSKQGEPSLFYLQAARSDLAAIYGHLGQPERAKKFRDEFAAYEPKKDSTAASRSRR
jgi:serine/threonine-protein kinase